MLNFRKVDKESYPQVVINIVTDYCNKVPLGFFN